MLLRQALLFLSRHRDLEEFLVQHPMAGRARDRFIAGSSLDDAVAAAETLAEEGFLVAIDHLGERVDDPEAMEEAIAERLRLIETERSFRPEISLRLSQIGLIQGAETAFSNLCRIAGPLAEAGLSLRVNMEESEKADTIIDTVIRAHREIGNIGAVIQSHLHRSSNDLDRLNARDVPVKVVKGAYLESKEKAYQDPEEITLNFMRLIESQMRDGYRPAIGTHDQKLIEYAADMAFIYQRPAEELEFHMFYGVCPELQKATLSAGHRVRISIPYGSQWFPYFMRRVAERPSNLWVLLGREPD